jgi:Zn finger protein HypA/HybF involved in hydrogenase expression
MYTKHCVICDEIFTHHLPQTVRCSACHGKLTSEQKGKRLVCKEVRCFEKRLGVDKDVYDEHFAKQQGKCRLCLQFFSELRPHINRNGQVINLLCQQCKGLVDAVEASQTLVIKYLNMKGFVITQPH